MEDALEAFHVPQQSRRIKLRITPPDQPLNNSNSICSPSLPNTHRHHYPPPPLPTATVVASSAPPSPSTLPPSQFLPHSLFNSLSSSLAMNNIEIISGSGGANRVIPTSRYSQVELVGNNSSSDAVMVGCGGSSGLNLSLATTHGRGQQQMSAAARCGRSAAAIAMAAAPAGPFTGYASILSRSRFLNPAEDLLDDFCCGLRRRTEKNVVDDDSMGEVEEDWTARVNVNDRGGNSNLILLLNEVYKRYRIYCQQMHSTVKSFESVAGLGNAAPFISCAVKAVSKHFHCLKNAILDHINFTSNGSFPASSEEYWKRSSGNNSASGEQKQQLRKPSVNLHNHHPVWRSQRGFPDKAVAVLKAWLFENFLHPYPTDSDKEMLARRTGLSRSQVSNWFTNARVRLWKPMVEEIHSLEKQSAESQHRKFTNSLTNYYTSISSPQTSPSDRHTQDSGLQRVQVCEQDEEDEPIPQSQRQNQRLFPCNILPTNDQLIAAGGGSANSEIRKRPIADASSNVYGSVQDTATGMPWSTTTYGQSVPFWLSK